MPCASSYLKQIVLCTFGPNLLLEYIELAKKSVWVFCNIVCKTWMNFLANKLKQKAIPLVFQLL